MISGECFPLPSFLLQPAQNAELVETRQAVRPYPHPGVEDGPANASSGQGCTIAFGFVSRPSGVLFLVSRPTWPWPWPWPYTTFCGHPCFFFRPACGNGYLYSETAKAGRGCQP